ncbi:serine/threonine-protein kinase MARK2-like isoform X1 [Equus asinus]|uniref:serine/threonine-protein kinase MARK2-like isoform X1 n=1 Tax=Equus asinus TaxID=9793 RepID=UPI0038F69E23
MSLGLAAASGNSKTHVASYKLLKTIGQSSYCKVKLAQHLPTGTEVAVKMVERSGKSASRAKALHCEVQSLKTVRHPNVLKLLEVVATKETSFIVSELVSGGDLLDHIRKSGPMAEDEARGKFRQLASALEYCHRKGVVHRDLRLEHVLLDGEGNVKLSGFGSSAVFLGQELSTQCGSPWYAAPETLQGRAYAGPPADVWSLGVVLFFLLTGAPPFWGCDLVTVRRRVLSGRFPLPMFLSWECRNLLGKMLTLNPQKRISIQKILKDRWVNMGQEKLRPYKELPFDTRDPWVMSVMLSMGFQQDRIEDSLKNKRYDSLMATYLMLSDKKPRVVGHSILVRPYVPPMDPSSRSFSLTYSVQLKASACAGRRHCIKPGFPAWLCRAANQHQLPKGNAESELKATEPARILPGLESRTATPSPTPLHGPGAFPSTHSTSNIPGGPEVTCRGNLLHAGQREGARPISPSGPTQGRWRAAGSFLNFLRDWCCCLDPKKIL